MGEEKETTALAIVQPITVHVGATYPFLVNHKVGRAKVLKIYQDESHDYALISVKEPWSRFKSRKTMAIRTDELKLRLIEGGVNHLEI